MKIALKVNAQRVEVDAAPDATLLQVLRDNLRLTGSKEACSRGECGACTVLIGGRPMVACLLLAGRVREEVTTIEGLAEEALPLREAFADRGAFQCGFCTSGQIVRATALLRSSLLATSADPEQTVRKQMSGNICRCTGYTPIVDAVLQAARRSAS
jgi:aerobic-type carbon monoxide dehydrogenase small subunit (CoxS/CutS family)